MSPTPGDALRTYFTSQAAATKGSLQSGRHRRSGDRRADREGHRRQDPRRTRRPPAARSTACSAPATTGCRTGTRPSHRIAYWDMFAHPATKPALYVGVGAPDTWWFDAGQGGQARNRRNRHHERLYRPPHSADDPDAARDHVRLLRRRAVRARRPGRAGDRAARPAPTPARTSRISAASGGDFGGAQRRPAPAADAVSSKYRGAQGLDPEFIKQLEKQFGFDKPAHERFFADDVELSHASISARATSATSA